MDYSIMRRCENFETKSFIRILLSHHYLAFFYGIFLFLYELSITQDIVSAIHPLLIIWSVLIIGYDILFRRIWEKVPYWYIFVLFIISVGITECLTIKAGVANNIKTWVLAILPVLIVYPICFCEKKDRLKNYIIAFLGAGVLTFFASLISLYLFFIRFGGTIRFMGREAFVGIYSIEDEGIESYIVLQGLYKDSGHAATYAIISIVFSCILFWACNKNIFTKKIWNIIGKIFCILNSIVQFCYFVLANSRGGWLSLLFAIFVISFIYFFYERKRENIFRIRFCVALLIAALNTGILGFGLINIRDIMSSVSVAINEQKTDTSVLDSDNKEEAKGNMSSISENKSDDSLKDKSIEQEKSQEEIPSDSFERPKETGDSIGSGRLAIWKEAFELFTKRPFFGDGAGNNAYYAKLYDVGERLKNGKAIHNSYLDLLVDYGIVGFILMMGFYVLCAWKILMKLIEDGKNCDMSFFFALIGVVATMSASFFLSCCFVNTTAMYFSNLLLVGYLVSGSFLNDTTESKAIN